MSVRLGLARFLIRLGCYPTGLGFAAWAGFLYETMTHIQHLEDLLLTEGTAAVSSVMADIIAGNYEVSIKYDGAPAIIFGTDADGTFVATKGYFNKKPKKFYAHDEMMLGIKDHELLVKMTAALSAVRSCHIPEGNIYWGDLLYWDGNVHFGFKPNVVKYYYGDPEKQVGMAIHTQLAGTEPYHGRVSRQIWTPQTHLYKEDVELPEWGGMPHEVFHPDVDKLLADVKVIAGDDFWTRYANYRLKEGGSTDLDFHMAWVYQLERHQAGKLTREKLDEFNRYQMKNVGPTWFKLKETFDAIEAWKTKLYKELNVHGQMVQTAVIDKQFLHEGFVIKTPSTTVKIIDREIFSAANFALWAKS